MFLFHLKISSVFQESKSLDFSRSLKFTITLKLYRNFLVTYERSSHASQRVTRSLPDAD